MHLHITCLRNHFADFFRFTLSALFNLHVFADRLWYCVARPGACQALGGVIGHLLCDWLAGLVNTVGSCDSFALFNFLLDRMLNLDLPAFICTLLDSCVQAFCFGWDILTHFHFNVFCDGYHDSVEGAFSCSGGGGSGSCSRGSWCSGRWSRDGQSRSSEIGLGSLLWHAALVGAPIKAADVIILAVNI